MGYEGHLGQEEDKSIEDKIIERTGLEAKQINDHFFFHESEDKGEVIILLASDSHFEEDLAQMEKTETLLSKDKHEEIVAQAFEDTLKMFRDYIPEERITRLFPGMDIKNIDAYDLHLAKINVVVLSKDSFKQLLTDFYSDNSHKDSGGFTMSLVSEEPSYLTKTKVKVNLADKPTIVLKEISDQDIVNYEKHFGKFPKILTEREERMIAYFLNSSVSHELLHNLEIARGLPDELSEGFTEWYSYQVVNKDKEPGNDRGDYGEILAYPLETKVVSILMSTLIENGFDSDTIDKAYISNNEEARNRITQFFNQRYGEEETTKIMTWDFGSSRKALKYVVELESKQDSEIGRFLKTYPDLYPSSH